MGRLTLTSGLVAEKASTGLKASGKELSTPGYSPSKLALGFRADDRARGRS